MRKSFPEVHPFIFTAGFSITERSLFQGLMCVEHYLAVVHPVTFLKNKWFCSAVSWFTALSSCFLVCLLYWNIVMFMCYFLLQFLLFLSVNLFCSVSVLWALKKPGPGERGKERKEDNHMKRSVLSHSNNYCDHVHHICACDYCRIFIYSFTTKGFDIYILQPSLFHYTWVFLQPVLYLKRVGQLSYLCCWSLLHGILFLIFLLLLLFFFSPR